MFMLRETTFIAESEYCESADFLIPACESTVAATVANAECYPGFVFETLEEGMERFAHYSLIRAYESLIDSSMAEKVSDTWSWKVCSGSFIDHVNRGIGVELHEIIELAEDGSVAKSNCVACKELSRKEFANWYAKRGDFVDPYWLEAYND